MLRKDASLHVLAQTPDFAQTPPPSDARLPIDYESASAIAPQDAACYIADMIGSLRGLARGANLSVLANLLEVAYEEALMHGPDVKRRL